MAVPTGTRGLPYLAGTNSAGEIDTYTSALMAWLLAEVPTSVGGTAAYQSNTDGLITIAHQLGRVPTLVTAMVNYVATGNDTIFSNALPKVLSIDATNVVFFLERLDTRAAYVSTTVGLTWFAR